MRGLAVLLLAAACGGAGANEATASAPETGADPGAETRAAPAAIHAAPGGDAVMAEDLRVLCAGLEEARRDTERPLRERLRELERSVRERDPAQGERIDDLLERPAGADTTGEGWAAAVRARAEGAGVVMPEASCPALGPVLSEAAGQRHEGVSFAEDLARLCTVAAVAQAEDAGEGPEMQAFRLAERIDATVTNPTLREMVDAIQTVDVEVRYATFVGWALADPSIEPGWSCAPLETLWSPG